jgi:phosphatidylglycerophosphate synthase
MEISGVSLELMEHLLSPDLLPTLILVGLTALVAVLYMIRVAIKGRAHFERVDRQGGSPLMSKGAMEMVYWSIQPVARLLIFLHITPNMLTWASFFFGLAAGASLAVGHFGSGGVFATISALLDAMDGLVARLTGTGSKAGVVFDSSVDRYTEFFFLGGLVIYYREIPILQGIALLAFLGAFMVAYSTAKAEAMHVELPKTAMRRPERALYLILGAILCPVTIPIFEVYREYSIPIGHPMVVALCLVAVIANVTAIERLQMIARAATMREKDEAEKRQREAAERLAEEERSHQFRNP